MSATTYYALGDLQNGTLMHSGRNNTTLEQLAESLLSYYSVDYDNGDPEDQSDWAQMQKMTAQELADFGEFEILSQNTPWPDEPIWDDSWMKGEA